MLFAAGIFHRRNKKILQLYRYVTGFVIFLVMYSIFIGPLILLAKRGRAIPSEWPEQLPWTYMNGAVEDTKLLKTHTFIFFVVSAIGVLFLMIPFNILIKALRELYLVIQEMSPDWDDFTTKIKGDTYPKNLSFHNHKTSRRGSSLHTSLQKYGQTPHSFKERHHHHHHVIIPDKPELKSDFNSMIRSPLNVVEGLYPIRNSSISSLAPSLKYILEDENNDLNKHHHGHGHDNISMSFSKRKVSFHHPDDDILERPYYESSLSIGKLRRLKRSHSVPERLLLGYSKSFNKTSSISSHQTMIPVTSSSSSRSPYSPSLTLPTSPPSSSTPSSPTYNPRHSYTFPSNVLPPPPSKPPPQGPLPPVPSPPGDPPHPSSPSSNLVSSPTEFICYFSSPLLIQNQNQSKTTPNSCNMESSLPRYPTQSIKSNSTMTSNRSNSSNSSNASTTVVDISTTKTSSIPSSPPPPSAPPLNANDSFQKPFIIPPSSMMTMTHRQENSAIIAHHLLLHQQTQRLVNLSNILLYIFNMGCLMGISVYSLMSFWNDLQRYMWVVIPFMTILVCVAAGVGGIALRGDGFNSFKRTSVSFIPSRV